MTNMVVRTATPDDREFLAWSILTATRSHLARGWFDISLNRPEVDCLKFLAELTTTTIASPWHYSRFTIASEGAARPAASLCAVTSARAYRDSGVALLVCLKNFGLRHADIEGFWNRGSYLFHCTTPPDKGAMVIEVAATIPSSRNQGFGAALLSHAIAKARSEGMPSIETSCFIGNDSAERTYTRAGFSCVGEKRHPNFESIAGAPGIRRFVRAP